MKIRNGFVSNSSSSSFIVLFDKKPESREEVKQVLGMDETRPEIVDQIWYRSQICDGHVRTPEEIRGGELHQSYFNKKEETIELQQYQVDYLNAELKRRYDWDLECYNEHNESGYYKKPKEPKYYKVGDKLKDTFEWCNWLDHEDYSMSIFPDSVIDTIVSTIDSYFEIPEHPYKVAVNMEDQHYHWDAGPVNRDRVIFLTNETVEYAIDNGEKSPRETLKKVYEELEEEEENG